MNKTAYIDIGTNSVRMMTLSSESSDCMNAIKYMNTTRIGRGVDKNKKLSKEGITETVEALKNFKKTALEEGASEIIVIGTSALRDAENTDEFVKLIKDKLDLDLQVISGDEEARLGFLGVTKGLKGHIKADDYILVVDIGGGSTELIVGKNGEIEYAKSIDIGAVRLSDKFVTTDPVSLLEQQAIADYIRISLKEILKVVESYPIKGVIGIGGTITTIGSIALEMKNYDRRKIHNYYVPLERIYSINKILLNQKIETRKEMIGLQPKRADIIPYGLMILHQILLSLEISGIAISEYDNLEGLHFDLKD
jgi:exopolyphosphatase/guanosine-5'-triphosphate,3'-diphosphate pyrophosphatase